MKRLIHLFAILTLAVILSSCLEEDEVCYQFSVFNATDVPMTVHLSSWGNYKMYINRMYESKRKFREVETIENELIFSIVVGGDPDQYSIPPSVIPPWEYITAIDLDGVSIPKEYFSNLDNWVRGVSHPIGGKLTTFTLYIEPELLEELSN